MSARNNISSSTPASSLATGNYWQHRLSLIAVLMLTPLTANAEIAIHLQAKHITVNQRTGISTYTGNVRLRRGTLTFNAAKAIVTQRQHQIDTITASGNPVVVKKKDSNNKLLTTITGQHIIYSARTNKIIIMGNVVTRQGLDEIQSTKISYDVSGDVIVAASKNGSARVSAVFHLTFSE